MAVKAINDFTSLDRLIPILLVFSAYPSITNNSLLLLLVTQGNSPITTTQVGYSDS